MTVNNKQTCRDIRAHAKALGLSMRKLLERAGVNRSQWARWLKNEFEPKQSSLDRVFAVGAKTKAKKKAGA